MFLELATTTGAVIGAMLAAVVAPAFLYILLGVVLLFSAVQQVLRLGEELPPVADGVARSPRGCAWSGSYPGCAARPRGVRTPRNGSGSASC